MTKKLLIIDDDPNVTEVIQDSVAELFEGIDRSLNVDAAIENLNLKKYDLIILDINLDGRNGAEIIKFLIDNISNINANTPVFIISGIINQNFIEKNKYRFAGILIKPFDLNELIQMTMVILQGRSIHNIKIDLNINYKEPFNNPQLESKINKVFDLISQNPKYMEAIELLNLQELKTDYFSNHIGRIINITVNLAQALEWSTDKTIEKFILAALFHNFPLKGMAHLFDIYTSEELAAKKSLITKEEYELVFNHPTIAADKILTFKDIPDDVAMIIRQHHETPKERGFPNSIGQSKIIPLSAIFIVAHDISHEYQKNSNWKLEKYLDTYKMKFKGPHFQKIFTALENLK